MNHKLISGFLMLAMTASLTGLYSAPAEASTVNPASEIQLKDGTYKDGQVLVTLATPKKTTLSKKGTVSFDEALTVEKTWNFGEADVLADNNAEKEFLEDKTLYISKVTSDTYSTAELIEELDNQAYVVSVEPDYYQEKMSVTRDTYSDSQWYLDGSGKFTTSSSGIHYSNAKNVSISGEPVVAVVDSGVDYTNEDLSSHMWKNTYSSLSGTYGYDYGDNDSDPMDMDVEGHGTHCAGVISAAVDNDTGIAGVSTNAKIMALKIFDSKDEATNSYIVGAFNYIYKAQQLGVNITAVNCSWGGGSSNQTMASLIDKIGNNGALFIFAAGNSGVNQDSLYGTEKECPYDINSDYIVTVGASTTTDTAVGFSDYGASSVTMFAPGTQILSTINSENFFPTIYNEEKRNSLCTLYDPCDSSSSTLYPDTDIGQPSQKVTYQGISYSDNDFYNHSSSGSIEVKLSARRGNDAAMSLYADVSSLNINANSTYYTACDYGYEENGDIIWNHHSNLTSTPVSYKGKTYMRIVGLSGDFSSLSAIYLDNIAVSVANPDTSTFGKYATMNGTSMAAPIVSGAVAVIAAVFPNETGLQLKERLTSCVRTASSLSDKCSTGGILDMSKIVTTVSTPVVNSSNVSTTTDSPNTTTTKKVLVTKVKLNKKSATLRYSKKLKLKATITPSTATNKKVKWYVGNTKYAKVTQAGVVKAKKKGVGHTVRIYAKAKDGSGKKAYCKVKIKKKK